jgi:Na+/H+ antiporter NhaD/arsenite permease-like protein
MTHGHDSQGGSNHLPLVAIALLMAVYIVAVATGTPAAVFGPKSDAHATAEPSDRDHEAAEEATSAEEHADEADHAADHHEKHQPPAYGWVLPFAVLLLAIAVLPLVPHVNHWWESNLHRFYVAAGLGLLTLAYYAFAHHHPIEAHWPAHDVVSPFESGANLHLAWTVFANAMLGEFIPFIVLLFSLYTISGGIRIEGDLRAHALTNATFICVGGLLASFIGTTGAAMLLIRPLLETNRERRHVKHTVVFFIFVVCNCGGCLLPIGDPPLFLGYLRGVPFLWTMQLALPWLFVNVMLLVTYFVIDHFYYYPHEEKTDIVRDETQVRLLKFSGLRLNGLLLAGVILSVAMLDPSKTIPGTSWHPWMYLREIVQLSLVGLSLLLGSQAVRQENHFNYHAIIEVAALFSGIFICMQPALQILDVAGPTLGIDSPQKFFWATGGLSAVLDNAPTYVVFFETAKTVTTPEMTAVAETGVGSAFLVAISLGAVFMGAMTYIGNGPNFMVKALAEKAGVKMPSFFGYMAYSCAILLPILGLTALIFMR